MRAPSPTLVHPRHSRQSGARGIPLAADVGMKMTVVRADLPVALGPPSDVQGTGTTEQIGGAPKLKGWEGIPADQSGPVAALPHVSAGQLSAGLGGKRPSPVLSSLLEDTGLLNALHFIRAARAVPESLIDALEGSTKATQSELRKLLIAIASPEERNAMLDHPSAQGPISLLKLLSLVSGSAIDRPAASVGGTVNDPEIRAQMGTLTLRKGKFFLDDRPLNPKNLDQLLVLSSTITVASAARKEEWVPASELRWVADELRVRDSHGIGSGVEHVALRWKDPQPHR